MTAGSLRVVVVDDTAELRDLLRFALVRGGMSVVGEAGDGLAGIEVVTSTLPDVVLLDLSMPVMDGLEALPRIRALVPDARIIVLSGFGPTQMAERALEAGADGYIQKGASLGRILDQIRDVVAERATPTMPLAPAGPSSHEPGQPSAAAPETPSAARDALGLAPFGVVEVGVEPPYRVIRVNPAAEDVLGVVPAAGTTLADLSAELAATVTNNRLAGDSELEATIGTRPVLVTLRHTDSSLLFYLQPTTDEIGRLRSAIATTAHELRGPVSVLCAVAEAVLEDDLEPDDVDRLMGAIARQARLLDSITGDLLMAAQVQRGTLRIETQVVDPAIIAQSVLDDQNVSAGRVEVHDRRCILADPLRLQQMLGNLVNNARKYGEPPLCLRVRPSTEHARQVCIDVEDQGSGVPVAFRPQLFGEFTRATGTAAMGTGLGLHVVRTLAQGHGGSISYAPGANGGSVFTLSLPAA